MPEHYDPANPTHKSYKSMMEGLGKKSQPVDKIEEPWPLSKDSYVPPRNALPPPPPPENNNDKIKQTNPKDAVGVKKVPFSTVPAPVIAEVGLALLEGARKYGRHNYRACGVRGSVYYDAAWRHLTSWYEGEDIDGDSGLNHVVKAIACLVVLRDSMLLENWVDDRPPKVKQGWVKEMNKKAAEIIEKYPNAVPPFLETDKKV